MKEERTMKRTLTFILALVMVFSLAACGGGSSADAKKVADYISDNEDYLIKSFEGSITASGLTCKTKIAAEGTGFVINVRINELEDLDDETKDALQETYDGMKSTFESSLELMQKDLPEITYYTVQVCDKNGDLCATVTAGKK